MSFFKELKVLVPRIPLSKGRPCNAIKLRHVIA